MHILFYAQRSQCGHAVAPSAAPSFQPINKPCPTVLPYVASARFLIVSRQAEVDHRLHCASGAAIDDSMRSLIMSNQNQGGSRGGSHEQHVQAGQQSHKNTQQDQSSDASDQQHGTSRGGSHEQHVQAGQQSHKNSQQNQSNSGGNQQQGSSTQGGTHEQHVKAGQQSHKND
jgi:hypothetical protein